MPLSGFKTVTLAFGITAPLESETVPTIVAVSCCWHHAVTDKAKKTVLSSKTNLFIDIPLLANFLTFVNKLAQPLRPEDPIPVSIFWGFHNLIARNTL